MRIVVVGCGCFGAWTAYHLARGGHQVAIVDAYGPGNSRASSGGETRVIRMGYGRRDIYTRWSMRSLEMWKALAAETATALFRPTGVLWMAGAGDTLVAETMQTLERLHVRHERLSPGELESRWPQVDFRSIEHGVHEPDSGVLMARRAVAIVADRAVRAGARFVTARVDAIGFRGQFAADAFVFACGPWLPKVFPDVLGHRIFPSRQEVLYFGTPPGDARFAPPSLPAWIDFGEEMYGVPDVESRGVKAALDRHGPPFDPDTGERIAAETVGVVREYVERRFPALRGAPIVASEVCQYENTSNGDFLIDRHPAFDDVWLVGGGSGHGFKHGPALGEYVARLVVEGGAPDECFALATKQTVQTRTVF